MDQKAYSVDDLVLLLLALMPKERTEGRTSRIHRAFFLTSRRFHGTLNDLLFDTNGHQPVSERLDLILGGFKLSGVVSFTDVSLDNPSKMIMRRGIKDGLRADYEEQIRDQLPNLDKMVKFLSEQLAIDN